MTKPTKPTKRALEPTKPKPVVYTWDAVQAIERAGGEALALCPMVTVNVAANPHAASIHGITAGQELRVVAKLPSGPLTYDRDAVVLDAGNGKAPIILWASQIIDPSVVRCNDCGLPNGQAHIGLCTPCWTARCRL